VKEQAAGTAVYQFIKQAQTPPTATEVEKAVTLDGHTQKAVRASRCIEEPLAMVDKAHRTTSAGLRPTKTGFAGRLRTSFGPSRQACPQTPSHRHSPAGARNQSHRSPTSCVTWAAASKGSVTRSCSVPQSGSRRSVRSLRWHDCSYGALELYDASLRQWQMPDFIKAGAVLSWHICTI